MKNTQNTKKTQKQEFLEEVGIQEMLLDRKLTKDEMDQIGLRFIKKRSLKEYRMKEARDKVNSFLSSMRDKRGAREILITNGRELVYVDSEKSLKKLGECESKYAKRIDAQTKTLKKIKGHIYMVKNQQKIPVEELELEGASNE